MLAYLNLYVMLIAGFLFKYLTALLEYIIYSIMHSSSLLYTSPGVSFTSDLCNIDAFF